jgi:hypothetical protein
VHLKVKEVPKGVYKGMLLMYTPLLYQTVKAAMCAATGDVGLMTGAVAKGVQLLSFQTTFIGGINYGYAVSMYDTHFNNKEKQLF